MAKSKKSKKTNPKPSTDSILSANSIIEVTRATDTEFSCCVEDYSILKQRIVYKIYHKIYSHWWKVYFRKCHSFLFVYLNTDIFIEDVEFSLRRSDGKIMEDIGTEELVGGLYKTIFEDWEISNPDNLLLMNGTLTLQCTYSARPLEYNIVLTRGLQQKFTESIHNSYVAGLCNDLKHLYLNSRFSNFTIVAERVAFRVHSLIISLRSDYFAELFRNDPDLVSHYIEIDASPEIVHEVLRYIYSGELRDMELTYMIDIFYIANKWQITRLVQISIDYFTANFTEDKMMEILRRASQFNVLENDVLRIVEYMPQHLRERAEPILEMSRISGSRNV